jgi:hypothetical protein
MTTKQSLKKLFSIIEEKKLKVVGINDGEEVHDFNGVDDAIDIVVSVDTSCIYVAFGDDTGSLAICSSLDDDEIIYDYSWKKDSSMENILDSVVESFSYSFA